MINRSPELRAWRSGPSGMVKGVRGNVGRVSSRWLRSVSADLVASERAFRSNGVTQIPDLDFARAKFHIP